MIDSSTYKDIDRLLDLISKIKSFVNETDLSEYTVNIIDPKITDRSGIVLWNVHTNHDIDNNLKNLASDVTDIVKTFTGLQRIIVNFLGPMSCMPMHIDHEEPNNDYNMVIPLTNNGWFLLDDKVIKSTSDKIIIFDGTTLYGVMNDTTEKRISVYFSIDKERFSSVVDEK